MEQTSPEPMTFEDFQRSFFYGDHADMQFKFLAKMSEEQAADAVAAILARLGEAFDTGNFETVRDAAYRAQVEAYAGDDTPTVEDAPFAPVRSDLAESRLALISAGGVYRVDDDPMGPDGPTQERSLSLIKHFLRGSPTLSRIPRQTPNAQLTARHPGYDALTAQRDPGTVFPLAVLRELEEQGEIRLADTHYAFVGATSQVRLRDKVAPMWARQLLADEVDVCLLVAT
ncbi:MAG: glycine/sarcosine/betaine reductase selenoprotein B family protein [Carbonactinosporaceae bacterium]